MVKLLTVRKQKNRKQSPVVRITTIAVIIVALAFAACETSEEYGAPLGFLGATVNKKIENVTNSVNKEIIFTKVNGDVIFNDIFDNATESVEVKLSTSGEFTLKLPGVKSDKLKSVQSLYGSSITATSDLNIYTVNYFTDDTVSTPNKIQWKDSDDNYVILMYADNDGLINGLGDITNNGQSKNQLIYIRLKKGWNTIIRTSGKLESGEPGDSYKWALN
jgi:hypothetical protein